MASETLIRQAEKMYGSMVDTTDYASLLTQPFVDEMNKNLKEQEEKTEALIATMPAGINIAKVPEELQGIVTDYLTESKAAYVEAAKTVGSGIKPTDPRYLEAVEKMNQIRGGFEALDANLVKLAQNRKLSLDNIDNISPGAGDWNSTLQHKFSNGSIYGELTLRDGNFYYKDKDGNDVNTSDYQISMQQSTGITDSLDPLHTAAISDKRHGEEFKEGWYRGKIRTNLKKAGKNGRVDFAYSGMAGDDSGQTEFIDKYITEKHGITDGDEYTLRDGTVVKSNPTEFKRLYESYKEADFKAGTELGNRLEDYLLNTLKSSYDGAKTTTTKSGGGGSDYHDTSFGSVSKVRASNFVNKIKSGAEEVTDLRGNTWNLQSDGKYMFYDKATNKLDPTKTRTPVQMMEIDQMDSFYPDIYRGILDVGSTSGETPELGDVGSTFKPGEYEPFESEDGNIVQDQDLKIVGVNPDGSLSVQIVGSGELITMPKPRP